MNKFINKKNAKIACKIAIWFVGIIVVFSYLYSKYVFDDYRLSYTNLMYESTPWNTMGVETKGPMLSDATDSALPAVYAGFYKNEFADRWNSDIAMGTQASTFEKLYPVDVVYILPINIAVTIKSALEFFFAFLTMYLLLKYMNVRKSVSAVMSVGYMFSSTMVMWHGWPHSDVMAFAPLVMLMTMKLIDKVRIRDIVFLALSIYMVLVAGMPTYAAYFMYLAGFYVVFITIIKYYKDIKKIVKVWLYFGIGAILGILCSVPYTVELLSSVGSNGYSDSRSRYATATLATTYIRTMIYPYIRENLPLHINESTIYFGIIALFLIPLTVVAIKRKTKSIYFIVFAVINGLFIFTNYLDFIYGKMPAINTSLKYRVICVFIFCIIVIAAVNLSDIIENPEGYRKYFYVFLPVYGLTCYLMFKDSIRDIEQYIEVSKRYVSYHDKVRFILAAMFLLIAIYIFISKWKYSSHVIMMLMFALAVWDGAGFAKYYLPWISKNGDVIPKPTETIAYLQDNTKDNERIVALGNWTLFPNTGVFYDIPDIRAHDFVLTNPDMKEYYMALLNYEKQEDVNTTDTRIVFGDIKNYELLKYMGVKYMVNNVIGDINNIGNTFNGPRTVVGSLTPGVRVEQKINNPKDGLLALQLLMATNGRKLTSDAELIIELEDVEGNILESNRKKFASINDNSWLNFNLKNEYKAGDYILVLKVENPSEIDNLTVWMSNDTVDDMWHSFNGEKIDGTMVINAVYKDEKYVDEFCGNDGLMVGELDEYSKKAEIVTNIVKCKDEEEVLDRMSEKYLPNTMFVSEKINENASTKELGDNEYINVKKYKNDKIVINYSINEDRYVLINDYYDDGWNAFVNGKETKIVKANYLTRAIYVKADTNGKIVLKYSDKTGDFLYFIMYISFGVLVIIICVDIMLTKKKNKLYNDTDILTEENEQNNKKVSD